MINIFHEDLTRKICHFPNNIIESTRFSFLIKNPYAIVIRNSHRPCPIV